MKKKSLVKKMAVMAMLSALAYVFVYVSHLLHLSIVPSVSFLTYDPKDIVICIGGFIIGPLGAFIMSVVVSLLEMITFSTTGWYGLIMNITSTCFFVIPAALIYKYKKSFRGALLSLFVGFVSELIVMTLWNIIITPVYMKNVLGMEFMTRSYLIQNFLGWIILFNIIKVGINIAMVLLLYKPIISALRGTRLIEKTSSKNSLKSTINMIAFGSFLLIVAIITIILLKHFA